MALFIVKIAPKQRSIHEEFLGIVGELPLIRENTCQSLSLSSDINQRTVYHQTSTSAQSIIRHQASHSLSSDINQCTVYHQTPSVTQSIIRHQPVHSLSSDTKRHTVYRQTSIAQSIIRHQPAHIDNSQHTPIEFLKPS